MIPSPLHIEDSFFSKIHMDACSAGCQGEPSWEAETDIRQNVEEPNRWLVHLSVKQPKRDENCPLYAFDIEIIGLFTIDETYPEEKREHLVRANGPAVLFGSVREMLAFLTNRGPHPGITLPTVTFVDELAEAEDEKTPKKVAKGK